MERTELVRVDKRTYHVLKTRSVQTGVPMGKQIKFHVFGKPRKVKRLGER